MNILVTGGAGFIGTNFILQRLAETDSRVKRIINLDAVTYAGNPENLKKYTDDSRYVFVKGDISDTVLVDEILVKHNIDAIVNFAAESHVDRSIDSPEQFFVTNAVGTLRLLNSAKKYWSNLSSPKINTFRFLHVSTDEVYGSLGPNDPPWNEECKYAPNSPYAASKAASDHIVRSFFETYRFPAITTNCSNNYGPYHFPEKLIPLMILNALEGESLPVYGDGKQIRDWLFVEDHANAIWIALTKGRIGQTYNVGGSNEFCNIDIVNRICTILDRKHPRSDGKSYTAQITYVVDRPGHDRRYAIDSSKIRNELGWCPKESFETGIEKTVDWYLTNRSWADEITSKKYARERLGVSK